MPLHSPRCETQHVFGQFWGSRTCWAKTKWETFRFLVTCTKSEVSAVCIYIYISQHFQTHETHVRLVGFNWFTRFHSGSLQRRGWEALQCRRGPRHVALHLRRSVAEAWPGCRHHFLGLVGSVGYTELHFLYIYLKHFKTCFLLFCFSSFLVCLKNISKRSWYPHNNWHMPDTCRWYIFVTRGEWTAMTLTKRSVLTIPYWYDTVEWMDWRCVAYAGA